jgi:hypothetical protein
MDVITTENDDVTTQEAERPPEISTIRRQSLFTEKLKTQKK